MFFKCFFLFFHSVYFVSFSPFSPFSPVLLFSVASFLIFSTSHFVHFLHYYLDPLNLLDPMILFFSIFSIFTVLLFFFPCRACSSVKGIKRGAPEKRACVAVSQKHIALDGCKRLVFLGSASLRADVTLAFRPFFSATFLSGARTFSVGVELAVRGGFGRGGRALHRGVRNVWLWLGTFRPFLSQFSLSAVSTSFRPFWEVPALLSPSLGFDHPGNLLTRCVQTRHCRATLRNAQCSI